MIGGKLACVNKGVDFCKLQLTIAASKFKTALAGSEYEESLNVQEIIGEGLNDDHNADDGDDDEDEVDDNTQSDAPDSNTPSSDLVQVIGESISQSHLVLWTFPAEVSQSTLDGRNGSAACSVIVLIFAHGIWHQRLDLQPTPLLSPLWIMHLCAAIRVGNRLYDRCRHSLPQRYLSASEGAIIAEQSISVTVDSPLPVRACDEHAPTTLLVQVKQLCTGVRGDAAVLIANEKTVLFMAVGSSSIVLVDTHRHGLHGSVVLLGHRDSLDPFIHMSQNVLDLRDDTYANLSFISFE